MNSLFKRLLAFGFVFALFFHAANAEARIISGKEINPDNYGQLFSAGDYLKHLKNYNIDCFQKPGVHCINYAEPAMAAEVVVKQDLYNLKLLYRKMAKGDTFRFYEPELNKIITASPNSTEQVRELIYIIHRVLDSMGTAGGKEKSESSSTSEF